MANPFFKSGMYPWPLREATALYEALWQGIPEFVRIDVFYKSSGGTRPLAEDSADVVWKAVLERLCSAGMLEELCTQILGDPMVGTTIRDAIGKVREARDPVQQTLLSGDRIFLDRRELRDKLDRLADSSALRVLLVRGPGDSGKSYTNWLVYHVARTLNQECIYLHAELTPTIERVLDELFASFGESAPKAAQTDNAFFTHVCTELQKHAKRQQKKYWVIMDDLASIDSLVLQFFNQFAMALANHGFAESFRLVLLDYPEMPESARGVPTKWGDYWEEDRVDAARVTADEVASFILEWSQRKSKHQNANLTPTDAAVLAADIVAAADAATHGARLQVIHEALKAKLARL